MKRLYHTGCNGCLASPLLLSALLLAAGCASVDPRWQTLGERERAPKTVTIPAGGVRIPLVRCDAGHLFVEASCRGIPLFLLLDTGSPRLQLSSVLARELGVATLPVESRTSTGGEAPLEVGLLPELQLGDACATEITAFFCDWTDSLLRQSENDLGRQVDGVLGGNLLPALGAQIDYANNCLLLGMPSDRAQGHSVPLMRGVAPGRLYVKAWFRRATLCLMVDTGAGVTGLDMSLMRRYGIASVGELEITSVDARRPGKIGLLPELQLGSVCVKEVPVVFEDMSGWLSGERRFARQRVDGILGTDLLSVLNARVDYAHRRLILLTKPGADAGCTPPVETRQD